MLPAGITQLELSEEFRTRVVTTTDAMGNEIKRRTAFADDRTPDISIEHAFGPVEVGLGAGLLAYGWVAVDTHGIPQRVSVSARFMAPQRDGRYDHRQTLAASHKVVLQPGRFAIAASVSTTLHEVRQNDDAGARIEGLALAAGAGVTADTQITRRLGLYTSISGGIPLHQSADFGWRAALGVSATLLFAFRKWDLFAGGELGNITRDPSTFLSVGFAKRWGL